jgi:4a-hydroxytetrahydrobiopterin dehydratase
MAAPQFRVNVQQISELPHQGSIPGKFTPGEKTMPALSDNEIAFRLTALPGWQSQAGELVRTFKFEDFRAALRFVNRVGELAEAAGHHPDIDIRYNRVHLALRTHDAGGVTAKDFDLAAQADQVA